MNASVLWDIVSRAKIECHEAPGPSGILSCEHGHGHGHMVTHEEFRFCVQIVFLHFNFLVLTLKSRCYFVYDIFAIVHTPVSCNVLLRVLHRAVYRS